MNRVKIIFFITNTFNYFISEIPEIRVCFEHVVRNIKKKYMSIEKIIKENYINVIL